MTNLIPLFSLLHFLDGSQFNDKNIGRKPLTPITNNNNKNNKPSDDMIEFYTNINRIRNNILDETSESYSRLHLNNTIHHSNTSLRPRQTPQSNNTHNNYTRFNDDDNVFRSNTSYNAEPSQPTLPVAFRDMMNVHQICSWLCTNPDILILAYNMHISMQTLVASAFNFISSNFNSLALVTGVSQMLKQEDRVSITIIYFIVTNC